MKKIVRKLQKAKVPASDIKEMDLSNWEAERTARGEPTQSANIDDRRKENDGPRRKQEPVLDKDNESEPKSDSSNITSKNITSRENPNPEPLKPMSDFASRSINSPIRSERSMPGPQQKTADRIIAFRRARGLDEEAAPRRTAILAAGTNDWADENVAHQGITKAARALMDRGHNVKLVMPAQSVNGKPHAYNAAQRAARELGLQTINPSGFGKGTDHYHISPDAAKKIRDEHPDAEYHGDSNAVRLGAREGVTGFTGKSAHHVAAMLGASQRRSEQPKQRQPEQPRPQRDTRSPEGDVYPSREDERQITNTPSVSNSEPESRESENNQRVSAQPKQKPVETPKPQNPYEKHGANEPDSSAAAFFRADREAQKMGSVQGPNNPKKVDEEIANAVGTGNIAGMGVPLEGKPENWAEPPVRPRKRKKYKDRTKDEQNATTVDIAMLRRADPLGEELETGSFAGNKTFVVNDDMFIKARMEKKRGQHWKTYLGGDKYEMIRQHANKNKKAPIILQNEKTGAMMYARYGGKHDNKRDS